MFFFIIYLRHFIGYTYNQFVIANPTLFYSPGKEYNTVQRQTTTLPNQPNIESKKGFDMREYEKQFRYFTFDYLQTCINSNSRAPPGFTVTPKRLNSSISKLRNSTYIPVSFQTKFNTLPDFLERSYSIPCSERKWRKI